MHKSKVRLLNTKNYDVIKKRCIHHMIILTLLPLAYANVGINTFSMINYKGLRNQNYKDITHNFILNNISRALFFENNAFACIKDLCNFMVIKCEFTTL